MNRTGMRYARRDWIVALMLVVLVFALGLSQITRGVPYWGDDSAGYMNEGIAIARGEFRQQVERNLEQHPTPLPAEAAESDGLVYVWGYPLLLAIVFRLVGFDAENYSNIACYKFPSLICLALLTGALYLLMRRRFSRRLSAPLALAFGLSGEFAQLVNMLYSDVCFMFAAALSLLLLELFLSESSGEAPPRPGRLLALGIALGAALWYGYEVRLNGVSLCLAALFAQLLLLIRARDRKSLLPFQLAPWLVYFALRIISERWLLLPATPNLSDMGVTPGRFVYNICYYGYFTLEFLGSLAGLPAWAGCLLFIPCCVGFVRDGFRRENLHLTLLFVGTYAGVFLLPYGQRLRYLYGILPVLMLYLGWGLRRLRDCLPRRFDPAARRRIARALACALTICALGHAAWAGARNLSAGGAPEANEMYADQAVEMYRFVRNNTPEDAVIACAKPRALYLNTGRRSYRAGFNGHELLDADYYLCILSDDFAEKSRVTDENRDRFRLLHATQDYSFYEILPT